MISQNISSDYKLVNFNVPKYLIENLDNMVRFKRMSRTSYLIQLIEQSLITEKKRIEEQGKLNFLIKDIEEKNRKILKNEMIGLQREIEELMKKYRGEIKKISLCFLFQVAFALLLLLPISL